MLKDHIDTITDLLLGAAHADQSLEGQERDAVRRLLIKVLGGSDLPAPQAERFETFKPAGFDAEAVAGTLTALTKFEKRRLLELICKVNEADDVLDFDEDKYLRTVARGLGLSESEIKDLTLEVIEESDLPSILD